MKNKKVEKMPKKTAHNEKNKNFNRLAPPRINMLLNRMRILGNLANKSSYQYTEEQINKMFNTIRERLTLIENKFLVVIKEEDFKF